MAKATFTLNNGTVINIDGNPEEIHRLLQLYDGTQEKLSKKSFVRKSGKKSSPQKSQKRACEEERTNDLIEIVNLIKECNEADEIERNIIDKASQVDRVLLPLYIVHEYKENAFGLQSGEVSKITKDLGIPISQPNVSRTLSYTASRYVMGDRVRKAKQPVKYRLNRKGVKYLKGVIKQKQNA